jgi:hypothetical protein
VSLTQQPAGDYCFLPGIAPYSCGVVSNPGFEIVHVTFQRPVPYRQAFARIDGFLATQQRPRAALCAIELRSPRPYSFAGFADFNAIYGTALAEWGLFVGGINPVARTNVAPVFDPPSEPALYGFSFTRPCDHGLPKTFVVAGAGELPEGVLARDEIIALGDTSTDGLEVKSRFVMELMQSRLRGLGADWPLVNNVNVYTAHSLMPLMTRILLHRMGSASIHGVHWHFSRPPIKEIEFEMDLRGTRTDLHVA